ncbi:MAG TPA: wax ester/triacylglycerol synthase family O-acyltransferase [Steroidobacteraceae bacterium]|nr:wax ester/triacylglycerol synthase family O-acyltransferase [Steroidobacteraceae bacterium]
MATTTPIPMLDLMFFLTESVDNPRHVGSVLILRKPKRAGARVVQQIVDAYRAARPRAPFNRVPVFRKSGMPLWRELEVVDVRRHVMHLALPAPGSNQQLHELIADLHAPMLERHRPGWKVYVIDGLEGGRFAIYHKCHHALVDGESGMEILRRSLSESATDRTIRTTVGLDLPSRPRRAPAGVQKLLEREARVLARRTLSIGVGSLYMVEQVLGGLRGYTPRSIRAFTAPHTPMNEPIYNSRAITHMVLPLDGMKTIARRAGATLNDVTLCVLDAAMNRYLRERGLVPEHPLVALCPVSLRDEGVEAATTNVSAIWPPLGPVNARIDTRLRAIAANTRAAKAELKTLGKDVAYAYAVMAFALSETLTVAKPELFGMRPANMLVSNVRGPERPLYLNGARLEALFPVSTLIVGVGLNVTFMSYAGQLVFGFTANGAAMPEVESLARYVNEAFSQLERATSTGRHARIVRVPSAIPGSDGSPRASARRLRQ